MGSTATAKRTMAIRPTAFDVESETTPGVVYHVQLPYCDCKDFRYRRTTHRNPFCKHLIRAFAMAGWHVPGEYADLDADDAFTVLVEFANLSERDAAMTLTSARNRGLVTLERGRAGTIIGFDKDTSVYLITLA